MKRVIFLIAPILGLVPLFGQGPKHESDDDSPELKYPAAHHTPGSQAGWENYFLSPDPHAPEDEAQGGKTARGTPIHKRIEECFPAETRNLFADVDQVASGPHGKLQPLVYSEAGGSGVTDAGRDAIRGQNTWMLWGEGNEAFWGWLQEQGYGLDDFLILLDSRNRGHRFREGGFINQPGMKAQTDPAKRILGLYLDQADGDAIILKQPPSDHNVNTKDPVARPSFPSGKNLEERCAVCHKPGERLALFDLGDSKLFQTAIQQLPNDGVDTAIYGYPSGVVGLRLMPNPDFFGNTAAAKTARDRWQSRVVESNDAYYKDPRVGADPDLIRPFRVSMSCAFCHVGPHPLSPPKDPENPTWANMSSTIGNQYWNPQQAFANQTRANNFLFHFLASQQSGTIDTSLVSTDNINNANTINAIFDLPARLTRAKFNEPELQSQRNLLVPSIEDGNPTTNPRRTPRVLLDGSDSVGAFGALARVYLNIGTYPEEWFRCHNPIIGFKLQSPFGIATNDSRSVYWRAGTKYRVKYLAAFFTLKNEAQKPVSIPGGMDKVSTGANQSSSSEVVDVYSGSSSNEPTAPMKLVHTSDAAALQRLKANRELAIQGRKVFVENCAICHSSKQPDNFSLKFSRAWRDQQKAGPKKPAVFTLPMDFSEWELFKQSPFYKEYLRRITELAGTPGKDSLQLDPFLQDNYLSTDTRVPLTLVGTNSGRAAGTNGMRGQVWDNFTSEDYKNLPAVGPIRFYNPFSAVEPDILGNNDAYAPPGGGPGYYRPASLISLWATAPYLHNNSLGLYNHDPSVAGRLAAFDDGIKKLLWNSERKNIAEGNRHLGDLRSSDPRLILRDSKLEGALSIDGDPGYIYRTPVVTDLQIPEKFVRPLFEGIVGKFGTSFFALYIWILFAILFLLLAIKGGARQFGFVFALLALGLLAGLVITRLDKVWPWLKFLPVLPTAWAFWLWFTVNTRAVWPARITQASLILISIALLKVGLFLSAFVAGDRGALELGPIPAGTPVNLIMNINPEAPIGDLLNGGASLLRGTLIVQKRGLQGSDALKAFDAEAGLPLLRASKCPDFILDRGHWFGEALSDDDKKALTEFLITL